MSGGPVTFLPENYAVSRTTGNISTEYEVSKTLCSGPTYVHELEGHGSSAPS